MHGAWLVRAVEKIRENVPAVEVTAQQLDKIIDFVASKSYISKGLKQRLLKLW